MYLGRRRRAGVGRELSCLPPIRPGRFVAVRRGPLPSPKDLERGRNSRLQTGLCRVFARFQVAARQPSTALVVSRGTVRVRTTRKHSHGPCVRPPTVLPSSPPSSPQVDVVVHSPTYDRGDQWSRPCDEFQGPRTGGGRGSPGRKGRGPGGERDSGRQRVSE